jgi:hypothetical protein
MLEEQRKVGRLISEQAIAQNMFEHGVSRDAETSRDHMQQRVEQIGAQSPQLFNIQVRASASPGHTEVQLLHGGVDDVRKARRQVKRAKKILFDPFAYQQKKEMKKMNQKPVSPI